MSVDVAPLADPASVRRRLRGEIRNLLRHSRRRRPTHETIHEIRLSCKRLRAWLQLLRAATEQKKWRRYANKLQRLARSLGTQRDGEVMALALQELAQSCPTAAQRQDCLTLAASLQRRQTPPGTALLSAVEPALKALLKEPIPVAIRLSAAMTTSYRKGWKLAREVLQPSADEAMFHALRKRTKALLYQLEILSAQPHPQHTGWKRLGSHLGRLHDWQTLIAWLQSTGSKTLPATARAALLTAAHVREARCLRECRPLIRRLYSRSPARWSAFRTD